MSLSLMAAFIMRRVETWRSARLFIATFTFPHIGNVGTNEEDIETVNLAATPGARGIILHTDITQPSNYRSTRPLDEWLRRRGVIGLSGVDTRALTSLIRTKGMPNAV